METSISQQTDEQLARDAAAGDRAGFDELVRRYSRPLLEYAASRTAAIQDAEDVVQETFLRALTSLGSFDPRYSLKNWLFTIAYRLIVSGYRRKKPAPLTDDQAENLAAPQADDPGQWLWQAAGQMGPDAFTALWLRYRQDMPTAQIARVMHKSVISVRVLLHRSRKELGRRIEAMAQTDPVVKTETSYLLCMERSKS